jgi:hypothetical protein
MMGGGASARGSEHRTYRALVDRRRSVRSSEKYREPTDAEWPNSSNISTCGRSNSEARANSWHGEVEGLAVSLAAAENKLTGLDRAIRNRPGPTPLGLPGTRTDSGQAG